MTKTHELIVSTSVFNQMISRERTADIRHKVQSQPFENGDILLYKSFSGNDYTGDFFVAKITNLLLPIDNQGINGRCLMFCFTIIDFK